VSADEQDSVLTPMSEIAHLADAAKRLGCQDRLIRVDRPAPPEIKTPGRHPNQWLLSGAPLNAFAAAALSESAYEREDFER
jgi:hypothetical protein